MTGHHIYTRSWYEYGSRSKNPGTFTVELTDGLFAPDANDIIYRSLNPVFSGTQPSTTGYSLEGSLLRLFHPTPESTVVARSYFVNDEITGRGQVQYSHSLVFTRGAKEHFLANPQHAFKYAACEPYEEFFKRVQQEGALTYTDAYDPKPSDYSPDTAASYSRQDWTKLGFNEETFIDFFTSLGKAITAPKGDKKVAVVLPANNNGEALILMVLSILPSWLRRKFGAASRWTGVMEGGVAAAVGGMQLVCYMDTPPPYDVSAAVVDLVKYNHRNIEPILEEQAELAKWYWENIDSPDVLNNMTDYMLGEYKQLMGKMPYPVFAHCFWLWHTFRANANKDVAFSAASRAINSLVSAFGRNLSDYFTDTDILAKIFQTYSDKLGTARNVEVHESTVRAICQLAKTNARMGGVNTQDLVNPLFEKLFEAGEWSKLEFVQQYYAACMKERSREHAGKILEAFDAFKKMLECPDKKAADVASAALSEFMSSSIPDILLGSENHRKTYKIIARGLKKAGRQVSYSAVAWEDVPKNAVASREFYNLEKFNREEIANLRPPGSKQIDNIMNGIQWMDAKEKDEAVADLLELYWQSDELKNPVQLQKYINYLHENTKLPLFLKYGIGADDIRLVFVEKLNNMAFEIESASFDEKINVYSKWQNILLEECGFDGNDAIMEGFSDRWETLVFPNLELMCKTASPKAWRQLANMIKDSKKAESIIAKFINDIDDLAGSEGDFSKTFKMWDAAARYLLPRMEYWFGRITNPPLEWALSRAVLEARLQNVNIIADAIYDYSGIGRSNTQDLLTLYGVLDLVFATTKRYDTDTVNDIIAVVRYDVRRIIDSVWDGRTVDDLTSTADKFESLYRRYSGSPNHMVISQLGVNICEAIKSLYAEKRGETPNEILRKFNPNERRRRPQQQQRQSKLEPIALLGSMFMLFIGSIGGLVVLIGGNVVSTVAMIMPDWLVIITAIVALVSLALMFLVMMIYLSRGSNR
ncbi:MAG: hypothetical protein FWE34_04655 [Defluviitaleaceae bacterium]|nr:hypothetical protein [Defluviitaleaceae bacterium]